MIHLTKTELNAEIKSLEGMISAYKSQIRVTKTNMENDEFFQRSKADHEAKIQWHLARIADLTSSRENGEQIISDAKIKIADLSKRVKLLTHRRDIERLLELQKSINELQEDEEESDELEVDPVTGHFKESVDIADVMSDNDE
jgi:hypothetical protein